MAVLRIRNDFFRVVESISANFGTHEIVYVGNWDRDEKNYPRNSLLKKPIALVEKSSLFFSKLRYAGSLRILGYGLE